jgi:hypothetical protein
MGGDRRSERIEAHKNTILAIREAKSDMAIEEQPPQPERECEGSSKAVSACPPASGVCPSARAESPSGRREVRGERSNFSFLGLGRLDNLLRPHI